MLSSPWRQRDDDLELGDGGCADDCENHMTVVRDGTLYHCQPQLPAHLQYRLSRCIEPANNNSAFTWVIAACKHPLELDSFRLLSALGVDEITSS